MDATGFDSRVRPTTARGQVPAGRSVFRATREIVLTGRLVPVAPDPLAVARGLIARGHRRVALLSASDPTNPAWSRFSYVAADPDGVSESLDPLEKKDEANGESASAGGGTGAPEELARAPRWIGVVPYEGRRSLERAAWRPEETRPPALIARPLWYRYPAVACFDHAAGTVLVVGEDRTAAEAFAGAVRRAEGPLAAVDLRVGVEEEEPAAWHAERVAAARALILRGDLYQVNLARRLRVTLRAGTEAALYQRLSAAAPSPFSALLDLGDTTVVSTSPELLLCAETGRDGRGFGALVTEPIKGTRPRGKHAAADAALADELEHDPKERAELSMIVDVERNDLGRVAAIGSVRVTAPPHVVTHRTIHHRLARVSARARPGASRGEVLASMVPSGSVTGAPKVRAMEVIALLEARRRGLYTGGLGFVRHDGGVVLAMAIRTVVLAGREGEYWTGGGIVADSDPAREVEETRWKALQLMRAAGAA
jgi:anthranilate/para-aminobenzoate synthase component I